MKHSTGVSLTLSLPPEEAFLKLQQALVVEKSLKTIQTKVFWVPVVLPSANKIIHGIIKTEKQTFKLWVERLNYRNSFKPRLSGKIYLKQGETHVMATFNMHPFVKAIMAIWFIGFGTGIAVNMLQNHNIFYSVFPFLLSTAIFYSGKQMGNNDKIELQCFVERTFSGNIK